MGMIDVPAYSPPCNTHSLAQVCSAVRIPPPAGLYSALRPGDAWAHDRLDGRLVTLDGLNGH